MLVCVTSLPCVDKRGGGEILELEVAKGRIVLDPVDDLGLYGVEVVSPSPLGVSIMGWLRTCRGKKTANRGKSDLSTSSFLFAFTLSLLAYKHTRALSEELLQQAPSP